MRVSTQPALLVGALALLKKTQVSEKQMVNRGVPLDLVGQHPDDYAVEETIVWWQFTSTTSNISVLSTPQFLGTSGDRTIFQIMTSLGVDVTDYSAVKGESELLLPPAVALRITGVLPKSSDGLTIVTCEDDPDAPPLLE